MDGARQRKRKRERERDRTKKGARETPVSQRYEVFAAL